MIVAVSQNWGIGKNGNLLFKIPQDMKFFRTTTMGAAVVMGRKTLDSFPNGAPLKNRTNIVLTKNPNFVRDGVIVCHTKQEVLQQTLNYETVFVIGGSEIYHLFSEYCDTAYVTKVFSDADADKFIENFDLLPQWQLSEQSEPIEDNGHTISFCRYERKSDFLNA